MKDEIPVSLIIPTYNRLEKLCNLLTSIRKADFSCEVIVVDDCSTEDFESEIFCFEEYFPLIYHRNEENSGPSCARNAGVHLATNDLIAFTDDDCIVSPSWLNNLHRYISDASEGVAGVGGRTLALNDDLLSKYHDYNKILDPWFYNGRCLYIVTANAIFKKAPFLEVGGFDENVRMAGGEDVGLCLKLINAGYDLSYYPDAVVFHDYDRSIRKFYQTFYRYGHGCHIQYRKHYRKGEYSSPAFGGIK